MDLALFIFALLHLRSGGEVHLLHGLAALYIGFSIAFGPSTIRWADAKFAHRFAGAPPPTKPPATGNARIRYEWRIWSRILTAYLVSAALLAGGVWVGGGLREAGRILAWLNPLTKVLLFALIAPLIATLWPGGKDGE